MPRYSFVAPGGEKIERTMLMSEYDETVVDDVYTENGIEYVRDMAEDLRGQKSTSGAHWPMYSEAIGVHPDQIPEAMAEARRVGVDLGFTKGGRAILTSKNHRDKVLRAHGYVDKGRY